MSLTSGERYDFNFNFIPDHKLEVPSQQDSKDIIVETNEKINNMRKMRYDDYYLAENSSLNVISPYDHREKVLYEDMALYSLETLVREHCQQGVSMEIDYFLNDNIQDTDARRELFPINQIRINGHRVQVLNVFFESQESIDIPKRIHESDIAPDLYCAVYVNPKTQDLRFFGYCTHKEILERGFLKTVGLSLGMELNDLHTMDAFLKVVSQKKMIDPTKEDTSTLSFQNNFCNDDEFRAVYEYLNKYRQLFREDFRHTWPGSINYLGTEDYIIIAKSEELSEVFLNLQNQYRRIMMEGTD